MRLRREESLFKEESAMVVRLSLEIQRDETDRELWPLGVLVDDIKCDAGNGN